MYGASRRAWAALLLAALVPAAVRATWKDIPELLPTQEGSLQEGRLELPLFGHVVAFGHFTRERKYAARGRRLTRA